MQQGLRGDACLVEEDLEKPKFELRMRHRTESGFRTDDRKSSPLKDDPKDDKPRKDVYEFFAASLFVPTGSHGRAACSAFATLFSINHSTNE
ncbi:hypothetical protein AVEN_57011-1 [Araneus ventricosus]|uniref:Uncharacterized protein n=1 Tax=Araneus ventricosus TaxID=182803 RepID=A0A4Y2UWS7_ARAVE|nr:hypothetical protein AVEN_57011-1 [Araneus ventricosus]